MKAFKPLVEATARRYEGKGALYEDLLQEGYLALLELHPRCSNRTYLAKYLKDRLPARVRSAARRDWRYNGKNEELDPEKCDGACNHEFPWMLWVAEGLLNERDCDIACMVGSGYSQKEIAERLGLSQQAVSCRIARIREIMEKEMGNNSRNRS